MIFIASIVGIATRAFATPTIVPPGGTAGQVMTALKNAKAVEICFSNTCVIEAQSLACEVLANDRSHVPFKCRFKTFDSSKSRFQIAIHGRYAKALYHALTSIGLGNCEHGGCEVNASAIRCERQMTKASQIECAISP